VNDYRTLRLSLKAHPMSFLRARVSRARIAACADLKSSRDGMRVSVAGVVLVRQRPGSAQGVVFMTIEDETGVANIVVWPKVMEKFRKEVMGARLVLVEGRIQSSDGVVHLVADRLFDRSHDLASLANETLFRKEALPSGATLAVPLNSERDAGLPVRKHRHPRNVRILPRSRDFH
jgi:error-prone DNA polymerase